MMEIQHILAAAIAAWHAAWAATPVQWLKLWVPDEGILREFVDCPTCLGFWIGWGVSAFMGNDLGQQMTDAFLVSACATAIGKIDKLTSTI